MTARLVCALALCLGPGVATAQTGLRDRVQNLPVGATVNLTTTPLYPSMDVPAVVKASDLVVEGVVTAAAGALTPDGRSVATTYDIQVAQVLLDRRPRSANTQAALAMVKVRRIGGQTDVDGRTIRVSDASLSAFALGDRLILFLARLPGEPNVFAIVNGPFGLFSVMDGRAHSLLRSYNATRETYEGTTVASFRTQLQQLAIP